MTRRRPARRSSSHAARVLQLVGRRGLAHTRDVAGLGIPTVVLTRLVREGKLERTARGLYSLPEALPSEHRSLAEVTLRAPRGVVCLLSALRVHEVGTQAPSEVWLAMPAGVAAPADGLAGTPHRPDVRCLAHARH